jgi:Zn-finger nucleic acid-binding protein
MCPRCQAEMDRSFFRMTQLDRCFRCSLVYLDSMELNFLTGRNIERTFFQDPRIVTHCAHCRAELRSHTHCNDKQMLPCSACGSTLYQANVVVRVITSLHSDDPYRGSVHAGGKPQYEHLSYRLEVCVHCQGMLLQAALFEQILALFAPERRGA